MYYMGFRSHHGKAQFLGRKRRTIANRDSDLSCAKTAQLIRMPFGMLSRVDPWNHVLDGVPMPSRKGTVLGKCMARCKAYDSGDWVKG